MTKTAAADAEQSDIESTKRTVRADWIGLATQILVRDGVESVKVMNLAQKLNVSRSSFYWFFKSRQELLNELLSSWEDRNTTSIVERANRTTASITAAVLEVFECWVDEELFDPGLDFAVREWARRSTDVRQLVDRADNTRISAIKSMFQRHGYDDPEAFIRARVLYYMQVGYYALDVDEPMDRRLSYIDAYVKSFTGEDASRDELDRFRSLAIERTGLKEQALFEK